MRCFGFGWVCFGRESAGGADWRLQERLVFRSTKGRPSFPSSAQTSTAPAGHSSSPLAPSPQDANKTTKNNQKQQQKTKQNETKQTKAHLLVDGEASSASLFDFGLFFFHNARQSVAVGAGPYFYLPKMESHLEARLWNDVFCVSQDLLRVPRGTVRATVLIETLLAAFEMEEILFELR